MPALEPFYRVSLDGTIQISDDFIPAHFHGRSLCVEVSDDQVGLTPMGFLDGNSSTTSLDRAAATKLRDWLTEWLDRTAEYC